MHETWRQDYVVQVAHERGEAGRALHARALADDRGVERARGIERARWLGVQLRSLVALVAVVEEGSFVAAARRLGYSRSTISHQISQLETAVGTPLVVRGSGLRSVSVTPSGEIVVAHGRAVLKLLESAETRLSELAREGQAPAPRRLARIAGALAGGT